MYLGDFTATNTVYVYFNTFDSNDPSASVTLTGLAVTDIEIYKDGSTTQRSSDSGYTLLDTDGIDFDGITGVHGFSIDLSDNTDSGFFAAGSEYTVVVSSVTVDAATVNFVAAHFSIERSGGVLALIKAGNLSANVEQISGDSTAADNCESFFDGTGYAGTNNVIPTVTTLTGHTAQTGDNYARLGAPAGASVSADVAAVKSDTAATLVDTGTTLPATLSTIDGNVDAILLDTAEIGAAGAGLTDLGGMSTAMKAEVNAEADTAISDASLATAAALATVDTVVDGIQTDLDNGTDGLGAIKADTAAILTDTGTTLETHLTDIKGATFSGATDSLEAIRDRGDSAWTTGAGGTPPQLLQNTTIATLSSQTSFTLTAGSADDDAYNGAVVVVTDQSTSTQKAVGSISDYTGSTKAITLSADPAVFTMATGDTIDIIANASTAPSAAAVRAEIDSNSTQLAAIVADTNELQTDDVPGLIAALNDVAATDIVSGGAITTSGGAVSNVTLVATTTTNTDMRGTDSANTTTPPTAAAIADAVLDEALSGHTTAGTMGKAVADIETDAAAILVDTADMQPKIGTPAADLSADIAAVKADTAAILIDTNELQGDWTNGGRLDLIIDAILADTGTDGVILTAAERNSIADAILDRDMSTGTDSGSTTVRTVRQALRSSRNKVGISGGTMTVYKEDDSTASWTAAVTTTSGDPISDIDPAGP